LEKEHRERLFFIWKWEKLIKKRKQLDNIVVIHPSISICECLLSGISFSLFLNPPKAGQVQLDLTPGDILVYAGPLPWRSAKWTRFQCSEPCCPYVTMIQKRMNAWEEKHKEV
jgi:hypothetical protein